jgi:hypothetical protein
MKKLIFGLAALVFLGSATLLSAQARTAATTQQVCCNDLYPDESDDLISVTFRDLTISAGPGVAGTLLPLPGNLATVPDGLVIQDGLSFIITDVRVEYESNSSTELNLMELAQTLAVENVLLHDTSMSRGWQSAVGVAVTGNETEGVGVAIRKVNGGDPDPVIDLELVGYVTFK